MSRVRAGPGRGAGAALPTAGAEDPEDPCPELLARLDAWARRREDGVAAPFHQRLHAGFHDGGDEAGLVAEVVADGGDVAPGGLRDLAGGAAFEAAPREDRHGGPEDGLAPILTIAAGTLADRS